MDTVNASTYFDPFAMSVGATDLTFAADFSPASLFSPLSEDFGADFTSESGGSPTSPISPVLSTGSLGITFSDEFGSWENVQPEADPAVFKASPFLSVPTLQRAMTPAVNPMDLTIQPGAARYPSAPAIIPTPRQTVPLPIPQSSGVATRGRQLAQRPQTNGAKRKSSSASEEESPAKRSSPSPPSTAQSSGQPLKKTTHNMIEKRYRTNLNDKIAQLREAIPSLRSGTPRFGYGLENGGEGLADDDFGGLAPVPKLNKATILGKATEYIMQLEQRNMSLETENRAIRERMEGLEIFYGVEPAGCRRTVVGRPAVAGGPTMTVFR